MNMLKAKKSARKKVGGILSSMLALSLILAGCGKPGGKDLAEDMNRANDNVSSGSDAEDISTGNDLAGIPENISYKLSSPSGNNTAEVDAEVISAGYDKVGVYSANRIEMDEDYLKNLADKLFDGGKYQAVKPYGACSMEELEAEETYFLGIKAEAEADGYEFSYSWLLEIEHAKEVWDSTQVAEWQEGAIIWKNTADGCASARLRGEIDGLVYELEFRKIEGNGEHIETYSLSVTPLSRYSSIYTLSDPEYNLSKTLYGENKYSQEDAKRYACDLVKKLGFSDMELADFCDIVVFEDDVENLYMDGYRMFFVRNIGGVQNILCKNSYTLLAGDGALDESVKGGCQEYLTIDVNSHGLVSMTFNPRYELASMSDQAEKLSFEQVDAVAQDYMQKKINSYDEYKGKYTEKVAEVRLGYMTVLYENQYVLAPVWVYINAHAFENQPMEDAWFGVNALDGSIIQLTYDYECIPIYIY